MPAEKCEWVFGRVVATAPRGVVLVDVLLAVEACEREVLGMRVTAVEREARPLTEVPAAVADTVADAMRHEHQIAFFASRADYVRAVVHLLLDSPGDERGGFGCEFLLLRFRELSAESRAALDDHPLPRQASYPVVTVVSPDGTTRRASCRELQVMAAMCRALAAFAREHRDALVLGATDDLEVHLCAGDGPEVWLWLDPDDGTECLN